MAYIGNKPAELAVDIDNASVTTEKLANDAVTAAKIVDGTIIADDLNNGIITNSKVASNAAIAATKLAVSGGSNITLQSDGTFDLDASVDVTGGYSVGGNSVINSSRAITATGLTSSAVITAQEGRSNTAGTGQIVIDPDDTTISAAFRLDQTDNKLNIDMNGGGTWKKGFSLYANNDISFYDGSGNAKLFWDASDKQLGIGTASPSTRLTVGAGVSSEEIRVDAGAGWADITLNSNATNGGHIYFNDGSNAGEIFYYHPYDYMAFNTAGAEAMRIGSDGAVTLKPNGITTGLRLQGRSSDNNFYVQFKSNDGNTTYSAIGTSSADTALLYQSNVHKFQNTASNNTYMTIDTGGRVGIGKVPASSTGSMLQIEGNDGIAFRRPNQTNHFVLRPLSASGGDGMRFTQEGVGDLMVLDASGNLLVNTDASQSGLAKAAVEFDSGSQYGLEIKDAGSGTTGTFGIFYRGSTAVGSLATRDSRFIIQGLQGSTPAGIYFGGGADVLPATGGNTSDNNISLGASSYRWKDLYLSGSIEIENGTGNVGVGKQALNSNSANENTAVGYQAGYSQTSGGYYNTYMGYASGYSNTGGDFNTYYGYQSGYSNQGGTGNTYIGKQAGYLMSGGNYNTILGGYNGNQGGLDIRTSSNNIVLSDGAGNPRLYINANGDAMFNTFDVDADINSTPSKTQVSLRTSSEGIRINQTGASYWGRAGDGLLIGWRHNGGNVGSISLTSSGTTYNTTSDRRLKDNIQPITDGTEKLMAMNPVTHKWKADPHTGETVHGFIAQEMQEIVPEAVSGDPDGEEMMSMDYGRITPVLVAALQDAHKKIEALEKRLEELEAN